MGLSAGNGLEVFFMSMIKIRFAGLMLADKKVLLKLRPHSVMVARSVYVALM